MVLPETFDRSLAARQALVYLVAFCAVFAIVTYAIGGSVLLGVATGGIMAVVIIVFYAVTGELGVPDADE
ncbi:hypothetical protein [Halorubrum laminariae]|uniref:DUF2964 family protein n=1 Tax=Halorubrum laminariae TaxID=1433523 RepID=A0ABD6BVV6_9EURY|nr:hypothetical protein [Halorubrum laminariae]